MNELITACLDNNNVLPLAEFPLNLLSKEEMKIVSWVVAYASEHDVIPPPERVVKQFPEFIPIRADIPLPLEDLRRISLKRRVNEFALSMLGDSINDITTTGKIPIDKLSDVVRIASLESGIAKYSTFDRRTYFRGAKVASLGLRLIDKAMGSLRGGDFALLVGRLGVGKSTIAQWMGFQWWSQGRNVLYVSNESLPMEVFARIDGMSERFNPLLLRSERAEDLDAALKAAATKAKRAKGEIMIPTERLSSPAKVGAFAKALPLDMIILDGVYLMQPSEKGYTAKWERVAAVSNELKQLALDLGIPVVGITQLKRLGGKSEIDPEDIAYSDALGQDADFVISLQKDVLSPDRLEATLIKNRFGPILVGEILRINFDEMQVVDESVDGVYEPSPSAPRPGYLW